MIENSDQNQQAFGEQSLSSDKVQECVDLLQSIIRNRVVLSTIPAELRLELMMAAGRVSRPEKFEVMRLSKSYRRVKKRKEMKQDRMVTAKTAIREARQASVFVPPPETLQIPGEMSSRPQLKRPRHCYVCKVEFVDVHFFYDAMCPACASLNYAKRFQTASLHGKVAVITGARLKIGYQSALMMLRAGAKVIATTRFPRDAATRFASEKDYEDWKGRLEVHGLDLRHSPSVEIFAEYVNRSQKRLDILINNAAQTVRRPPGFYKHLLEAEEIAFRELPTEIQQPLRPYEFECRRAMADSNLAVGDGDDKNSWVAQYALEGAAIGLRVPALLSQIPRVKGEGEFDSELFPEGKRDADLQQVDLRPMNSWRMRLGDVPTPELIEVQLVNAIAPFILCSKLKPLMVRDKTFDKHIVNVSAMEGKFTRYTKTDKHPHTNMAKASLNMMTVTSAPDYAEDGIYMNAVDTGWVTDEDPLQLSNRKQIDHDFQPPLDIVDGAARVCDPFFSGLITGNHVWGKFLKDYVPTSW